MHFGNHSQLPASSMIQEWFQSESDSAVSFVYYSSNQVSFLFISIFPHLPSIVYRQLSTFISCKIDLHWRSITAFPWLWLFFMGIRHVIQNVVEEKPCLTHDRFCQLCMLQQYCKTARAKFLTSLSFSYISILVDPAYTRGLKVSIKAPCSN